MVAQGARSGRIGARLSRITAVRGAAVALLVLVLLFTAACAGWGASAGGSGMAGGAGTAAGTGSGSTAPGAGVGSATPSEGMLSPRPGGPENIASELGPTPPPGSPSEASAPASPPNRCSLQGSVTGICFDTPPSLACCSLAAVTWSQIVVGERFTVAGRVQAEERPEGALSYTALGIRDPDGQVTPLTLDADGRFHGEVAFDKQGEYWVVGQGPAVEFAPADSESEDSPWKKVQSFWVPYRAEVLEGALWKDVFGTVWNPGLQTLAVPAGETTTIRLRLTDAGGHPAANRTVAWWPQKEPLRTDGEGVATIQYADSGADYGSAASYSMGVVYVGVHALSYRVLRVEDGELTGFPSGATVKATAFGDEELFPIPAFLDAVTSGTILDQPELPDCLDANLSLPHWDADAHLLYLNCPDADAESEFVISPNAGEMWKGPGHDVVARFRAAESDGVPYADLAGLAAALNGYRGGTVGAYAAVTPDGGLAVSIFQVP